MTSLVLPNGLESIGARAFEGCKLSSISIPDSVTRIHADAFGSRGKSSSGTCEPSDVNNKNDVFDADSIPGLLLVDGWVVGLDSSSRIQNEQDDPTEYLNLALQDARIRGIACRAFEGCSWLRYLTLPSCVKYVGGSLFYGCSQLEWVVIHDGVEEIEVSAFSGCRNLSGVSIPDSVRTVGQSVFQGCSFIDKESIPGLEIADGWILQDVGVSSQLTGDDSFDGTYVISGEQGIRGIADGAFQGDGHGDVWGWGCSGSSYLYEQWGLVDVTRLLVGDGITAIGSRAFALCDDLTNVYVAASVKYIGEKAFYDCRGLKSVQLPDTLKGKIHDSVFAKCPESLKITYYEAPRPVHVVDFYDNYSAHTEYVHAGSSSVDKGKRGDVRNGQWNYDEGLYVWTLAVSVPSGRLQSFWMTGMTENSNVRLIDVEGRYSYKENGETYEGYMYPSEWKTIANHNGGVNEFIRLTEADWSYVPASVKYVTFTITVTGTNDSAADEDCQFYFGIGNTSNFPDDDNMIPIHYSDWLESREIEEGRAIGELPEMSRKQCRFLGWSTAPEGGEKVSAMTLMGESDVAYYAHWWCYGNVFEGVGLSALDEDDNIIVTLTNDVSGMVEIPDNVGSVTIDLNGHDIVGDGGPAIRIVKGDGDGGATQLAIVDTSDGEKGQIFGGGESAGIEVAEDAATGVRLDVEEGVGVFNGDGSEQELKPKLIGTGKVTTPKTWKVGQKVTWKATADKGSVFARWEGPLVDSLNLTKNERRNPSLAFAVPEGFETNMVTAVFIPIDDDGLYSLGITQTEFELNGQSQNSAAGGHAGRVTLPDVPGVVYLTLQAAVSGVWVTDDSQSYVTATASGLPSGLKFDAKKMCITGAPTKGGVYWVQIKAKNASGYQWAENVKVTVSGDGKEAKEPKLTRTAYHPLTVICATEGGTVSGTGVYAEGKKVTIKATAAKGYVFAGWYGKANSEGEIANSAGADYRSPSMSVIVPEMRYVFARFATKEEDAASLALAVEDATTEKDGTLELDLGACVDSLSLPKLSVAGLPSGVKYDAKTLKLVGKATKPGIYTVTVKATNASVTRATDVTTATFKITMPNFECAALSGLKPEPDAYGTIHAGVKFGPGLIDCTPEDGWTVKAAGLPAGLKFAAKETKDATYGVVPAWTIYGVPMAKAGAYTVTFTASKKGEKNQVATITLNVEALPAWAVGMFDGVIMDGESTDEMSVDPVNGQDACSPCGIVSLAVAANGKISGKLMMDGETWMVSGVAFETICEWRIPYNNGHVGGESGLWRPGDTGRSFGATVVAKYGKSVATNYVEVSETRFADETSETGYRTRGVATARSASTPSQDSVPVEWAAWQNLWKTEPWKTDAKPFAKASALAIDAGTRDACPYPGTITLKFAASGAVTASGKFVTGQDAKGKDVVYSASCSSVLVPEADAAGTRDACPYRIFLCFPPKDGKFEGYADEMQLVWDGAAFSLSEQ